MFLWSAIELDLSTTYIFFYYTNWIMNEIFHGLIDFSTLIFILDFIDFFLNQILQQHQQQLTTNKALYIQLCVQVRVKKAQWNNSAKNITTDYNEKNRM